MVFAYQKLQERQSKVTVFKIRGQMRSQTDVRRYWKRKQLNPAEFSPVANTPEGIEYRTPSPFPDASARSAGDVENEDIDGNSLTLITDQRDDLFRSLRHEVAMTRSPSSPRMLTSPEPFRTRDQAYHCMKVFVLEYVERTRSGQHRDPDGRNYTTVKRFANAMECFTVGLVVHASNTVIEVAHLDMLEAISKVTSPLVPYLMGVLLDMVAKCTNSGTKVAQKVISEVYDKILILCGETHPVTVIFRAASRLADKKHALIESLVFVAGDLLARDFGYHNIDVRWLLHTSCLVSQYAGNYVEAFRRAEKLHRVYQNYSAEIASKTLEMPEELLDSQLLLISCHRRLINLKEAEDLVVDGLRRCCDLQFPPRDEFRSMFLYQQGSLEWEKGQVFDAVEHLTEALAISLRLFGPADAYVTDIAFKLKYISGQHSCQVQRFGDMEAQLSTQTQESDAEQEDTDTVVVFDSEAPCSSANKLNEPLDQGGAVFWTNAEKVYLCDPQRTQYGSGSGEQWGSMDMGLAGATWQDEAWMTGDVLSQNNTQPEQLSLWARLQNQPSGMVMDFADSDLHFVDATGSGYQPPALGMNCNPQE